MLDPIAAGAGKSDTDHRPDVTGAYLFYPYAAMARTVREVLPKARKVGTLFTPGEVNSVLARRRFELPLRGGARSGRPSNQWPERCQRRDPHALPVGCQRICQIADNLSNASFPAIARACEMTKMPLFTFSPSHARGGAVLGVGTDFAENGRDAGKLVAEVIRGENPARIPFRATTKVSRTVNLDNARRIGLSVPAGWVRAADEVFPSRPGMPMKDATWTARSAAPTASPN